MDIVDDSRVSLFVALYDYDPYEMSPNTDMLDEELSFTEGQLLKVLKASPTKNGKVRWYMRKNGRRKMWPNTVPDA